MKYLTDFSSGWWPKSVITAMRGYYDSTMTSIYDSERFWGNRGYDSKNESSNWQNKGSKITYLHLRASSRSEFIKFAFNFLSSFVSTARHSESGPSSSRSPVSVSAAPSAFLTTASRMSACLLPFSSWYLWSIRRTYLPQWLPLTTMRIPLSRVELGLISDTHAGAKLLEVL